MGGQKGGGSLPRRTPNELPPYRRRQAATVPLLVRCPPLTTDGEASPAALADQQSRPQSPSARNSGVFPRPSAHSDANHSGGCGNGVLRMAPPRSTKAKGVQWYNVRIQVSSGKADFLIPILPPVSLSSVQRRSRSSAVMHVTPELEVLGSNPGGVGTQCPRR
eukprot:CAMPEP_0174350762 /NCGR_PEP_ID=MMETSP0811_2-20130205/7912_1 /TAXON_ID=73025 ORGANISM="Eutreptiella gymnastica-like, Strain CCMP1594" /NCGR_SAMPLE_ID=MMETSP0811_2 /ASSEMBLY_ACC=CAM_ASM_000667 /LENGTH=162 /DNA_ID=CAMNT_0015479361 /DNA_START=273 /DNA_END=761 /DNA_ORIENTATION=+